jgi:hypothetical protein
MIDVSVSYRYKNPTLFTIIMASRVNCSCHGISAKWLILALNNNHLYLFKESNVLRIILHPPLSFACLLACLVVFNVTFNNISVIPWRSVLLVEETGGPEENHRPVANH